MATSRSGTYTGVRPDGADTGAPLNLRKRLNLVRKHVDIPGKKIVDCGGGSGDYVRALNHLNGDTWGIEYDREKVAAFRRRSPCPDRMFVGDIQRMAFPDNTFDIALLNEVLEHVPDDLQGLQEIHRVLRPRGMLVLFSPNRRYPFETHGVYLRRSATRLPHYIPFIPYIPLRLGELFFRYWARNYWPGQLKRIVTQSGFTIVDTDYVWQTFENISGRQPFLASSLKPLLRLLSSSLERIPLLRTFGVSQVIIAVKAAREE